MQASPCLTTSTPPLRVDLDSYSEMCQSEERQPAVPAQPSDMVLGVRLPVRGMRARYAMMVLWSP